MHLDGPKLHNVCGREKSVGYADIPLAKWEHFM
jgi:hypothetical protein